MAAIYNVAPIKERKIKHNFQEWLNGEISEVSQNRDKLFRNFNI